jgi:hypothetical protein
MFNKRHNTPSYGADMSNKGRRHSASKSTSSVQVVKNNSVDEGIIAFGLWLNHEESESKSLTIKEIHHDKAILLRDHLLQKDITVRIVEGVPLCNECRSDDCMHVGFAICVEQMKRRLRSA